MSEPMTTTPTVAGEDALDRFMSALDRFMSAYRARYSKTTGGVRANAPLRDEVWDLNSAILATLTADNPTSPKPPVGYSYEIATVRWENGTYDKFEPRISTQKPIVPPNSIRNLCALYPVKLP